MKESYFSKNNIYYRINEFQPGRPTLVFIHGLSGSSSAWLEYEKKFEKNIIFFFWIFAAMANRQSSKIMRTTK